MYFRAEENQLGGSLMDILWDKFLIYRIFQFSDIQYTHWTWHDHESANLLKLMGQLMVLLDGNILFGSLIQQCF